MNQVDRFKTLPDNARIQAIGNLFKYNDRKTWDIGVNIENSTRKALKFSQLPYLSRQVVLNQTVVAMPLGFPIEFVLPDRLSWQTATVRDCGLVKFQSRDEQSQNCFKFESGGKTIYLPQLELARALFFTNNYLANAALINSALDLEFDVDHNPNNDDKEFPLDLVINALPTTQCPKILFDNEGFRHQIAWLLLNSDVKNSFGSIYRYFSQERVTAPNVERWTFRFDPPQLEGVKVAARGWKSADESTWFINRIELLDGLFFPDVSDIGYLHPNFIGSRPDSGKGKGGTYPQLPTQREIDENSDGSEDNESALIFCDATQRIYNRVPRTRKFYARHKTDSGAKEDKDQPSVLPPEVSTDDPNTRGDVPRAAVDGLDDQTDNAHLYLNKFDSFFKMLGVLEKEHGVKLSEPLIRKLPKYGYSKKHLMSNGDSPRCLVIVYLEYQKRSFFLLEVDTSDGKNSLATKIVPVHSTKFKREFWQEVPKIALELIRNKLSWPQEHLDKLIGKGNHKSVPHQKSKKNGRLSEVEIEKWGKRLQREIDI
ncbi:Tn7-like element transposition protein TnsE [Pseudoalteromonas xiamenensis]|uniref:Transposase n=1 Tax=Pseudoalteromonas xiamenensis TaxID=882626 RepID=A0A975DEG0_9GAMM|nr:Tn7-like element transposition protein TnsE [Pseudoalteromonas xiamenensis]QTH70318.1 transposase [Pseudoalteromonas xiamenensis]